MIDQEGRGGEHQELESLMVDQEGRGWEHSGTRVVNG